MAVLRRRFGGLTVFIVLVALLAGVLGPLSPSHAQTVVPVSSVVLAPSHGPVESNHPFVGGASTPTGVGHWLVASDGGIFAFGDAGFYGSTGNIKLNAPVVGVAPTPTGKGYWLVASDGGIFAFGDAGFYGSTGSIKLNQPIVGMSATPTGKGYWLVASDGGIFAFGDAGFYGSMGGKPLNQAVVGMSSGPSGYRLVASDGGVFAFGSAPFYGSTGNIKLNQPIVGMSATPSGNGYWFVASDGGVFSYGDAGFFGSGLEESGGPVLALISDGAGGYSLMHRDGSMIHHPAPKATAPDNPPVTVPPMPTTTTKVPGSTTTTVVPTTTTKPPTTTTTIAATTTTAPTTTTTKPPTTTTTVPTTTTTLPPSFSTQRFNFSDASSSSPAGYTTDTGTAFSTAAGYGWQTLAGAGLSLVGNGRHRSMLSDTRLDSFIHMQLPNDANGVHTEGRWERVLPVGTYDVTIGVGDPAYTNSRHIIRVEGAKALDFTPQAGATNSIVVARVHVSDGRLTIDAVGGSNTKLGFIDIATAGTGALPTPIVTGPTTTTTTVPATTTTSTTVPGNLPGWTQIFSDDFNSNAAEGQFLNVYGNKWSAYPTSYRDTSKKGQYNPGIISVNNGIMNMRLHTNSAGVPQVAGPEPLINGFGKTKGQLYGRYEVRFRADAVDGYKTAWLLWPTSEEWPRDGEIDFPEGDLTGSIHAFMHYQDATWADYQTHLDSIRGNEVPIQDHFGSSARYTSWHTAIMEWAPGNTRFYLDGQLLGTSTKRIPNTPMRYVLQTETELNSVYPARDAVANVQVDYVKVWKYTP